MDRQHVAPRQSGNISGFAYRLSGSGTRTVCDCHGSRELAQQCGAISEPNAADFSGAFDSARRQQMVGLALGSANYRGDIGNAPQEFAVVDGGPNFLDGMGGIF
jgi:hypothetical protein